MTARKPRHFAALESCGVTYAQYLAFARDLAARPTPIRCGWNPDRRVWIVSAIATDAPVSMRITANTPAMADIVRGGADAVASRFAE